MRLHTLRYGIVALIVLSFGFPCTAYAQANLFGKTGTRNLSPEQSSQLSNLQDRATVAEANVVSLSDLTLLSEGRAVTLNVFPGRNIVAANKKVKRDSAGVFTWIGAPSKTSESPGLIVLSVHGGQVTGTIRAGGQLFKIRPIGGGLHAVTRVDESKFPPEHPPDFDGGNDGTTNDTPQAQSAESQASQPNDDPELIRVLSVYTSDASDAAGDIHGLVQTAISETNQSYENSNISNASIRGAGTEQVEYDESGPSFLEHVSYLQNPDDGKLDDVHNLRDRYAADVVVLLVDDSQACGRAYDIRAQEEGAFAVVYHDCATGYYSFGHEIGHLQGARHDPAVDRKDKPFPYGHGYVDPGDSWRTVMAYGNACSGCRRLPYWSNPDVYYNGDPMGTDDREDNERVL
jgi:hypothetical protein